MQANLLHGRAFPVHPLEVVAQLGVLLLELLAMHRKLLLCDGRVKLGRVRAESSGGRLQLALVLP